MKRERKIYGIRASFAQISTWTVLAGGLLIAIAAVRIAAPSLRAADEKESPSLIGQTQEEVDRKSAGCVSCHTQTDQPTMHSTGTVRLGCTDCHGGDASARVDPRIVASSPEYAKAKRQAAIRHGWRRP